ncbi:VOC family protein [Rhodococcus sp. NPDC056960]|uniref:VOC family protein n=1 Tax=Rhodococcus sp. NPDC056960 TaxID=3345982 RepID=UPI00363FB5FE
MSPSRGRCQMAEITPPAEGIVLAHLALSSLLHRSTRRQGGVLRRADLCRTSQQLNRHQCRRRPDRRQAHVTLETPRDPERVSSFLNIRVADIQAVYAEWSARGAQFLTPPKQHEYEIRCYIRDPDGYLIEVGQTTDPEGDWSPCHFRAAAHPPTRTGRTRSPSTRTHEQPGVIPNCLARRRPRRPRTESRATNLPGHRVRGVDRQRSDMSRRQPIGTRSAPRRRHWTGLPRQHPEMMWK